MPLNQTIKDIKSLKIQGASGVPKAMLLALEEHAKTLKSVKPKKFVKEIEKAAKLLAYARPTEPMAQNLAAGVVARLKKAQSEKATTKDLQEVLFFLIKHDLLHIKEELKQVVREGVKLIKRGDVILTHCHSSNVEEIFTSAHKAGKKFQVYNTETRPLFQGRITAEKLAKAGLKVQMVLDSETDKLLHDKEVDKVIIGADVLLKDGSIINKIGSFGICEDASRSQIPVYVASSLLKFKAGKKIKIERRSFREIWSKTLKNVEIKTPTFEEVPAKFITGIITERGVLKPEEIGGLKLKV